GVETPAGRRELAHQDLVFTNLQLRLNCLKTVWTKFLKPPLKEDPRTPKGLIPAAAELQREQRDSFIDVQKSWNDPDQGRDIPARHTFIGPLLEKADRAVLLIDDMGQGLIGLR